MTSHLS